MLPTFHYAPLKCSSNDTKTPQFSDPGPKWELFPVVRLSPCRVPKCSVSLVTPVNIYLGPGCFFRARFVRSVSLARPRSKEQQHEACTSSLFRHCGSSHNHLSRSQLQKPFSEPSAPELDSSSPVPGQQRLPRLVFHLEQSGVEV